MKPGTLVSPKYILCMTCWVYVQKHAFFYLIYTCISNTFASVYLCHNFHGNFLTCNLCICCENVILQIFFVKKNHHSTGFQFVFEQYQILKNSSPLESPMTFPGAILTTVRPRHVNILHSPPPPGGALKGSLSAGVPLRSSNPDPFRTKIVHSASQLKTRDFIL